MNAPALNPDQHAAVQRGKAILDFTDEARMEIIFERLCLSQGFCSASQGLEAMRQRVAERLRAAGVSLDGWVF
jgi:hypothetical protein